MMDQLRSELSRPEPETTIDSRTRGMLETAATACVLRHPRPWNDPAEMLPYWSGPGSLPTKWQMVGVAKTVKTRVRRGVPGLDTSLSPYTGGFWRGLEMSGALVRHGGRPRLLPGRPWLEQDLARLPFPGRLAAPDRHGCRWLIDCAAFWQPAGSEYAEDVLAGILAGALRQEHHDGTWLVVPRTEQTERIIGWWKLNVSSGSLVRRGVSRKRGQALMVSPFYGVLLSQRMPAACATAMQVRHAGNCPLLPLAIWEVMWGAGGPPHYLLPDRSGSLPFICSNATRKRHGWTRDVLHCAAVGLNVAHVPLELSRLINEWSQRVPSA